MPLTYERYLDQQARWPAEGRHIVAYYTDDAIVVYQAYNPTIGTYAVAHGTFGAGFKLDRMTWIKPGYLWMMHRSSWGTAPGQEMVLAIWLRRAGFAAILQQAEHATFQPDCYASAVDWRQRHQAADVIVQWDPDHRPDGSPTPRRAIQIGLRRQALMAYVNEWIIAIEDMTPFVAGQRVIAQSDDLERLMMPRETVYPVADAALRRKLRIEA